MEKVEDGDFLESADVAATDNCGTPRSSRKLKLAMCLSNNKKLVGARGLSNDREDDDDTLFQYFGAMTWAIISLMENRQTGTAGTIEELVTRTILTELK